MNKTDITIIDDLMKKVGDDVSDAIMRSIQLVSPPLMLPIANRAIMHALGASAMILDAASGTPGDKMPTRESMVFAAYLAIHQIIDTDDAWGATIADVKKHFPDAKVAEVEILDRRRPKEAAA